MDTSCKVTYNLLQNVGQPKCREAICQWVSFHLFLRSSEVMTSHFTKRLGNDYRFNTSTLTF